MWLGDSYTNGKTATPPGLGLRKKKVKKRKREGEKITLNLKFKRDHLGLSDF
jgi:hypothetical protein